MIQPPAILQQHETTSPALGRALITALLAAGITDVVYCPGSRNAPLAMGLAAVAPGTLRIHTRIDERTGAFLALGMARYTHRPVPVIVTSGTAVANCYPAMVEAYQSHTPLWVISADRPARYVGTGASQTIDQRDFFGVYAPTLTWDAATCGLLAPDTADLNPATADTATPNTATPNTATLNPDDLRCYVDTQLHINAPFDVPLLAAAAPAAPDTPTAPAVDLDEPAAPTAPASAPAAAQTPPIRVDITADTLVIAGDGAWDVPGLEDLPTLAEPTAPTPYLPVHPLAAKVLQPDQIIVVGHPTLHRDVLRYMAGFNPVLADHADTERPARHAANPQVVVLHRPGESPTDPEHAATATGTQISVTGTPSATWLRTTQLANDLAIEAVREQLANPDTGFTGLHVAAAVADSLYSGNALFIGASNPVRDMSLVGLPFAGVRTFSPRGAAGIDGSISQAMGVALAHQSADPTASTAPRTIAVLGDVTALHDVGGLLTTIGPHPDHLENFTLVIANDNGGGIFTTLEQGAPEYASEFEQFWGTPHGMDFSSLAAGYGWDYVRVDTLSELQRELEREDAVSPRIVEAATSRAHLREMHAALAARLRI
ncbi:MAG: 2-succinyl-5-enolpyruvyl-6-hydroxy-3-cyclohexene-1-carboxylic-acid synthase [Corynebacterium sp.]|nr:2-succinyl-5-enolpyruvyl-6-hydroxy-3-cyclohexene-1-carboxylic-acid synthase [Corynebacterium sp.]